jgi:hypothetical protein
MMELPRNIETFNSLAEPGLARTGVIALRCQR